MDSSACASMNSRSIKKTSTNSNTNYHTEIKFVPINMDYCLLEFDALKFVLGGGLYLTLILIFLLNISGMDEINDFFIHTTNISEKKAFFLNSH